MIAPTSLVPSGRRRADVDGLTVWRFDDDGADRWVRLLAEATHESAEGSIRLADEFEGDLSGGAISAAATR